jgi:PAS domain S-box-containing protein
LRSRHTLGVALLVAVTIGAFMLAREVAERDATRDSEHRAQAAAAQIRFRITEATSLTESLRRFMVDEGGTGVTNAQFRRAALRWLSPADLPTVAWAERVRAADRSAYERRVGHAIVLPDEHHTVSPHRPSYLSATLISGFAPMSRRGVDLESEPGVGIAFKRGSIGIGASVVATQRDGTSGFFLVAQAPNWIDGALRPGAVVAFVPEATLRAAASNPAGLQVGTGDGAAPGRAPPNTVRVGLILAGQQFAVLMPREGVAGPGEVLPWIILGTGLVLAALAAALGVIGARRARAQRDFDRIFNLSADLVAVADFDGFFTRVNPAAEQVLGYAEEEVVGRPYLDFVHPEDRERTAAEAAAIAAGRRTVSFENRYTRKDGSYRVLEWTATAVPEERLIYSMARDVTERRRAEDQSTRMAQEQAALRRVATLVAKGVPADEIFSSVSDEVRRLFDSALAGVARFKPDGRARLVSAASTDVDISLEERRELVDCIATEVFRTGASVRLEATSLRSVLEQVAGSRPRDLVSAVACPILVAGRPWGTVQVCAREPLPLDATDRLASFTELIATAIVNAETRSELAASRKRIVASSDETRRRIERDLHDGTQQRLVSLGLEARAVAANVPAERSDLRADMNRIATGMVEAVEELRELSRGIHPAIDSRGGLGPALRALARRSAIPVELDLGTDIRLPEPIEVAAYFVASESMANAAKHAQGSRIDVVLTTVGDSLVLSIRDDGIGGADPLVGSGLVGLADRVEALGGSVEVRSPSGHGTHVVAQLPLELDLATSRESTELT